MSDVVFYEARGVRPLPRRVHGPVLEYSIGVYDRAGAAELAVSWWRDIRGGLSGLRGQAYVIEQIAGEARHA